MSRDGFTEIETRPYDVKTSPATKEDIIVLEQRIEVLRSQQVRMVALLQELLDRTPEEEEE